jgi:hypothetical protein
MIKSLIIGRGVVACPRCVQPSVWMAKVDISFFVFLQHDVQLDYYGKRLATCSSDRIIKVPACTHAGSSVCS